MRSEAYRSSLLGIAVFVNENDEKLLRHVHGLASDPENKNVEWKKRLQKHFKLELRNVPMKSDRFQISLGIKMLSTQWRIKSSTRSVN